METKMQTSRILVHPATQNFFDGRRNLLHVKPYSLTELAKIYQVCGRTFKAWITPFESEIGVCIGRYYSVNQVTFIFEKLGVPYIMDVA